MALYEITRTQSYEIGALLSTFTLDFDRVSMHGVRRVLLERQAESLGLPLHKIYISHGASNDEYENNLKDALLEYRRDRVESVVFGDLFLRDIREYREKFLSSISMKGIFPIWERDTSEMVQTFLRAGFKAIVTCVDSKVLGASFAGCVLDNEYLSRLPEGVDPCGENGEFHTFV